MRNIAVSPDVFALIWSLRRSGEDDENTILMRVLGSLKFGSEMVQTPGLGGHGYHDARSGVLFPEGFEIFRTYKGKSFHARAHRGSWLLLENDQSYGSLNKLSRAIGAKTENAWINWLFTNERGIARPISDLRVDSEQKAASVGPSTSEPGSTEVNDNATWRQDVECALRRLNGRAPLQSLYEEVAAIRRAAGRSLPRSMEAIIRKELEYNSSDSETYLGGPDIFYMPNGKGAGIWALR